MELFDRSYFVDRETLDPARVMESQRRFGNELAKPDSLDFLKQAVDLGVSYPVIFLLNYPVALTVCCLAQTSIMAVAYEGGVIMGADSRTSTGEFMTF